jgi:hypothetical protein
MTREPTRTIHVQYVIIHDRWRVKVTRSKLHVPLTTCKGRLHVTIQVSPTAGRRGSVNGAKEFPDRAGYNKMRAGAGNLVGEPR